MKLFARILPEQVDLLSHHIPAALTGHVLLVSLVAYVVAGHVEPLVLLAWCAAHAVVLAFRYRTVRLHLRPRADSPARKPAYWATLYFTGSALSGIVWGASVAMFQLGNSSSYVFFIISIIAGLAGVSILTLGTSFPVFAAMIVPLMGLPMLWMFMQQDGMYWASGISLFLGMSYLLLAGRVYSKFSEKGILQTQALHLSEQRFRDVSEAAGEYLWETDLNLTYTYASDKSLSIKGFAPAELLGKTPMDFMPEEDRTEFAAVARRAVTEKAPFSFQHRNIGANGQTQWEEINGMPICDASGTVTGLRGAGMNITEKKKSEEIIWQQANLNTLTQLPNRRLFNDRLEQSIRNCLRDNTNLAVLFLDLDKFKEVNDSLGHKAGDMLLMEVAERIRACVRKPDTVAHFGGDEFTIILSNIAEDHQVHVGAIAQKIIANLSEPFHLHDEVVCISASIGIAMFPSDGASPEQLVRHADQAMYLAKTSGRNQFQYFTTSLHTAAIERKTLIADLRNALPGKQLALHFQPIVELSSGRVHKAEALLRWRHPARGMVSPLKFIPLAEETGLINPIGDWVFKEAAQWAKRWSAIHADFQISVNKSPVQFVAQGVNKAWLFDYLREIGLPGDHIVVEITEGLMLEADYEIKKKLNQLKDAGMQIAVDDFGTGYSSLSYLNQFNFDYLKIDQSFVRDIEHNPSSIALSNAIIVMAHKLNLKVIAEGIETVEQRQLLADMGCDYGQGYFWSKPIPAEEFEKYLQASPA